MNILDKITGLLSGGAGDLVTSIGAVADKFITTPAEKEAFKLEITKELNRHQEFILAETTKQLTSEDSAITGRWQADMTSDSWMSKNTRPITLLSLLGFTFLMAFGDSIQTIKFDVKEGYIELFQTLLITVVVAYFGSRGIEKWQKIKGNGESK